MTTANTVEHLNDTCASERTIAQTRAAAIADAKVSGGYSRHRFVNGKLVVLRQVGARLRWYHKTPAGTWALTPERYDAQAMSALGTLGAYVPNPL